MEEISLDRVKRVARLYASNKEASQALGICRRHGIETPFVRRHQRLQRPQEDDSSIELLENVLIHSD
jgi:proline dehydrogenase